jgi:PTS system mannitol-specific IIC component
MQAMKGKRSSVAGTFETIATQGFDPKNVNKIIFACDAEWVQVQWVLLF